MEVVWTLGVLDELRLPGLRRVFVFSALDSARVLINQSIIIKLPFTLLCFLLIHNLSSPLHR